MIVFIFSCLLAKPICVYFGGIANMSGDRLAGFMSLCVDSHFFVLSFGNARSIVHSEISA